MTGQVLLAHRAHDAGASLHLADDVWLDSLALNAPSLGREIKRGGQPQPRAVRERNHGLHRAFPERLDANQLGSL